MNPLSPTAPPPRVGAKPSPVSTDAAPVLQSVLVIPWLPQAEDVQGLQPHASAPQLVLSGCTSFYLGGCGAWSHCGHLGTTRGLGGWAAREKVEQESERERERGVQKAVEGRATGGEWRGGEGGKERTWAIVWDQDQVRPAALWEAVRRHRLRRPHNPLLEATLRGLEAGESLLVAGCSEVRA